MLFEIMGCTDENGWCRNMLFNTIDALLHNRMLIIGLSRLSTTLMLCVGDGTAVCYYTRLTISSTSTRQRALKCSPECPVRRRRPTSRLWASPAPTKTIEDYQLWRPRPVHEVQAEEMFSSSSSTPDIPTTPPMLFSTEEEEEEPAPLDSEMVSATARCRAIARSRNRCRAPQSPTQPARAHPLC